MATVLLSIVDSAADISVAFQQVQLGFAASVQAYKHTSTHSVT